MPSERSMPSEITGEKAERTKARSISLQTWIRPFWMTVSVTGSRLDMAPAYHTGRAVLTLAGARIAGGLLARSLRRAGAVQGAIRDLHSRWAPAPLDAL